MMCVVPPSSTGPLDGGRTVLLDVAALEERCFGDRELEADLLGLFVGQCRSIGAALLAATDPASLRDGAHALRGSAAAVGADPLARALATIEERPGEVTPEARIALAGLLERTVAAAEARLAGTGEPEQPDPLAKSGGLA